MYTYVYTYVCKCLYLRMYVYISVCMDVCMDVCMYAYTYVLRPHSSRPYHILRPRRCVCFVFASCFYVLFIFASRVRTYICYVLAAVFASCFYVLFKFRFVREGTQGGALVTSLKRLCPQNSYQLLTTFDPRGDPCKNPLSHVFFKFMIINTSVKKIQKKMSVTTVMTVMTVMILLLGSYDFTTRQL